MNMKWNWDQSEMRFDRSCQRSLVVLSHLVHVQLLNAHIWHSPPCAVYVQCMCSVCIHQSFVATCMCNSVFGIYLVTELIIIECAASGCCTFAWICCISSCAYKYKTTRYTNTPLPAPTQLGRRVHPARPIFHGCLNSPCPANHNKLDPATLDFCHWLAIGRKSSVWLAEACNHASSISSLKSGAIEKRWKWPAINTLLYALTATSWVDCTAHDCSL